MRPLTISLKAMNTDVVLKANQYADASTVSTLEKRMRTWLERFEETASRFREDSVLSEWNRTEPGKPYRLSGELYELVELADQYRSKTGSVFNPYLADELSNLGYNRSFEEMDREQYSQDKVIKQHTNDARKSFITFNRGSNEVTKQTSFSFDAGGIGKGWAVDRLKAMAAVQGVSDGLVDAGGDMAVWGPADKLIGIASPFDDNCDIVQFLTNEAAVATSNSVYRSWKIGSRKVNHILDGRSGQPVSTPVIQATVMTNSTTAEAEVLAKVLLILGEKEGMKWLVERFPEAGCVCINKDGRLMMNKSFSLYAREVKF